nr:MAG TPA: hypothetical protein [Caudoviricetes sp.]
MPERIQKGSTNRKRKSGGDRMNSANLVQTKLN